MFEPSNTTPRTNCGVTPALIASGPGAVGATSVSATDPFSKLRTPTKQSTQGTSSAPAANSASPIGSSLGSRPTQTWSYKWLGLGVVAGTSATVALGASTVALGGAWLANCGSTILLSAAIFFTCVEVSLPLFRRWRGSRRLQDELVDPPNGRRVSEAVIRLALKAGIEPPQVFSSTKTKNMATLYTPGKWSALRYNPEYVDKLSQRELDAVVAHELSHHRKASLLASVAIQSCCLAAIPMSLWGTLSYLWESGTGIVPCILGAAAARFTVPLVIQTIGNIARRAEEMRTDARAVELTGDPDGLLGAIEKAQPARPFSPAQELLLRPLISHPSPKTRVRWLRWVCGAPAQSSGEASVPTT